MKVARRGNRGEQEEDANSRVQSKADHAEEPDLAEGTDEGEDIADKVELGNLGRMGKQPPEVADHGVEEDIGPAADGELGRVLPSLEAISVGDVVGRLPVVEGLITILDGCEECREKACRKEGVEGVDGLNGKGTWAS